MRSTHEEKCVCKEEIQEYESVDRRPEANKASCQSRDDPKEGVVKYVG